MPKPGQVCPGFIAKPERCWRMVYGRQIQATHCNEKPLWMGRWCTPKGDRWFRVWACFDYLDGLTGLRQFGGGGRVRVPPTGCTTEIPRAILPLQATLV